jgi:hypothetical protein
MDMMGQNSLAPKAENNTLTYKRKIMPPSLYSPAVIRHIRVICISNVAFSSISSVFFILELRVVSGRTALISSSVWRL